MNLSLRAALSFAALGLAIAAGCSSDPSPDAPSTEDAGADAGPPCSRLTTLCKDGEACEGAADCASKLCRDDTCQSVDPPNGVKDNDETDVDCGGAHAPACKDGNGCLVADDCTSEVCTGGICQVPSPTDGVKNGDETGLDCGGAKAPKCPTGEGCLSDADCDKAKCDLTNKVCLAPTHDDGIENLDETGIDCGGPTLSVKRCPSGDGCVADRDCDNVRCNATSKTCDPATKTDGLKNGTESDVDCGGGAPTNADRCLIAKACTASTDCASNGCSMNTGKCEVLSCATGETAGIVTCGAKETGEAGANHESCCKSLPLPTRSKRLDKYEITSGRFRTFLTSVGFNVRAWVQTYVAANPGSQLATVIGLAPHVAPDGSDLTSVYPATDFTGAHSLTAHMETDIDNYGGVRGCVNDYTPGTAGAGNYSANTYWMDKAHMNAVAIEERVIPRLQSDEKSLNCAMPLMFAAFCAWDGGEMATLADYQDVWPTNQAYPWGTTDILRSDSSVDGTYHYNYCNGNYNNGGFTCQCDGVHTTGGSCPPAGFNAIDGSGVFYEYPRGIDRSRDNEGLIGAPGRFQGDATALKGNGESWMDTYGNLAEYTGDFTAAANTWCDFSVAPSAGAPTCTGADHPGQTGTQYTSIPNARIEGVTWEGHIYNNKSAQTFQATFQYGKFGARCVRPTDPY